MKRLADEISKTSRSFLRTIRQPLVLITIGAVFIFAVLHLSGAGMGSPFWMLYLLPLCLAAYFYGFEAGLALLLGVFLLEGAWIYFSAGPFSRLKLMLLLPVEAFLAALFVYVSAKVGTYGAVLPGRAGGNKEAPQAADLRTAERLQGFRQETEEELRAGIREILSLVRRGTSSLTAAYYRVRGEKVCFLAGEGDLSFREDVVAKKGEGLLGKVFREGREVHIPRLKKQGEDLVPHHEESREISSLLLLPMLQGKDVEGILFLTSAKADAYREREVRLGDYALRAVARAFREWDQKNTLGENAVAWETLNEVSESLFASIDIEEVMSVSLRILHKLVECESGLIALTAAKDERIQLVLANDSELGFIRKREELAAEEGVISFLEREKKPVFYRGEAPRGLMPAVRSGRLGHEIKSFALLPLVEKDKLSGYIRLGSVHADYFSGYHEQVLGLAAGMVAMAISNARLHREVARQADRDGLTGLFNVTYFRKTFSEKLELVKSLKGALCLLMLDLDYFKSVNDNHGHVVGDRVLKQVAAALDAALREDLDLSARYGGEEFIVMLPGMTSADGLKVAERVRKGVAEVVRVGEEKKPQTVSIGLASLDSNCAEAEELIKAADKALYRAKEEGRDRVCVAEGKSVKGEGRE